MQIAVTFGGKKLNILKNCEKKPKNIHDYLLELEH